mmetsp:Transcript_89784/g.290553  ORF Transcript_89784/g.290553 Transcript_89784/m.290553 type:complete len:93 (-) Transcript_89784:877-1155(-)
MGSSRPLHNRSRSREDSDGQRRLRALHSAAAVDADPASEALADATAQLRSFGTNGAGVSASSQGHEVRAVTLSGGGLGMSSVEQNESVRGGS